MIAPETLHELLDFDFQNGKMFWKHRPDGRPQWNARYAGKEAFTTTVSGYKQGSVNGVLHLAHRVIYAAAHGVWPDLIDHINQDRSDNRISNLRAADKALNAFNSKTRTDNRSGLPGVNWYGPRSKWRAYITEKGRQKHLGFYSTIEGAAHARATALTQHIEPRG